MAELALTKAQAQEEIGRTPEALQILSNYILSIQPTKWTKYDEEVGLRYVKLSTDLRNDNLLQKHLVCIRNSCQTIEPEVMEHIADAFIEGITHRISDASSSLTRSQSPAASSAAGLSGGFDPATASEEEYLLYLATGSSSAERGGAVHVKPLQDYLVRVYRALLEVFKQNSIYIEAYKRYSAQAIDFCVREDRAYDIREMFKSFVQYHLEGVMEPRFVGPTNISLSDASAHAALYAVFAKFFDGAMALSRWNEVRNIARATHAFLTDGRWAVPTAAASADYYRRLAAFFWEGRNVLLHGFALKKVFQLTSAGSSAAEGAAEARAELATAFALAALSAPLRGMSATGTNSGCALTPAAAAAVGLEGAVSVTDHTRDYARDYALTPRPTRAQALQDLAASGALAAAAPEARELFGVLEGGFSEPAGLCGKVAAAAERVGERFPALAKYAAGLRRIAVFRTLEQCAQAYDVLSIARLTEMAQAKRFAEIRPLVLELARSRVVRMNIDHARGTISFPRETASDSVTGAIRAIAAAATAATAATAAAAVPAASAEVDEKAVEEERQRALEAFRAASESRERRQRYREARARRAELLAMQAAKERELEEIERQGKIREAEEQRRRKEEEERAKIRIRLGAAGELEEADPEALRELYKKHKEAERKRKEKLRAQEDAVADANYYERARRTEEAAVVPQHYERDCAEARREYDTKREETLATRRREYDVKAADKKLFAPMMAAADAFVQSILGDRRAAFDAVHAEWAGRRDAAHKEWEERETEARRAFEEEEEKRRKEWEAAEAEKKNRYSVKKVLESRKAEAPAQAAAAPAEEGSWRSRSAAAAKKESRRDTYLDDLLGGGGDRKRDEEKKESSSGAYVPPSRRGGADRKEEGAGGAYRAKREMPGRRDNYLDDLLGGGSDRKRDEEKKEGSGGAYVPPGRRGGADRKEEGAGGAYRAKHEMPKGRPAQQAQPAQGAQGKKKKQPDVDEDGFTLVKKGRRNH